MRTAIRTLAFVALVTGFVTPLQAQDREGIMGDLLRDVAQAETKIVGLAKAMPPSAHEWRPGDGVRSTAETLLHVAADNYYIPLLMGIEVPKETGITKEFASTQAFEKRKLGREELIAEVEKSFAFLKGAMKGMPDARLNEPIEVFGQKNTNRGFWILAATHLHEHLGQLIAYARVNKVTPPWSK